jgi:hypothetical protein
MAKDQEIDENPHIKVTGHLLIRDGETGEVILNKRDVNVTSLGHTGEDNARNRKT